jgi:DNA polymerase I-like protein with 3'-5' exonuclease and polymerase domains
MHSDQAPAVLEYLMRRGGRIAIDTETTGLRIMQDRVLYWSMATEDRRWFFPSELLYSFDPLFQRTDIEWYLANAKYDKHILANMGITLKGRSSCIIVMDALEDDTRPHGLKEQSRIAYSVDWGDFKDLFLDPYFVAETLGYDKRTFSAFKNLSVGDKLEWMYADRPDIVQNYATCDSFFTYMRGEDLRARLSNIALPTEVCPNFSYMSDYFYEIEVPLTEALWSMERTGFYVDHEYRKSVDGPLRDGIAAAKADIARTAGRDINPNSAEELRQILFGTTKNDFGLPAIRYTKGDDPKKSTDEKTLNILAARLGPDSSPGRFLAAVLKYRHLTKLHGTYVRKLPDIVHRGDGRVHCRLNQAGARTSRLSSADPNMQNIPIRNDPFKLRGIFAAPAGRRLIDYDYPQIEFRIAAFLANEEAMMEPIRKGWDIHAANAPRMFAREGFTYEDVMAAKQRKENRESPEPRDKHYLTRRDHAKTSGLATLYAQSAASMAKALRISEEEAQGLQDDFANAYPNIAAQVESMRKFAYVNEFTHTMLGRIRRMYKIRNNYNRGSANAEMRQAYNTLVQGTGAEMIKMAILRIHNNKDFQQLGGKLILTVHDELIAEGPADTARDISAVMKQMMADPFKWGPINIDLPIPVDPDGQIGDRWSELK